MKKQRRDPDAVDLQAGLDLAGKTVKDARGRTWRITHATADYADRGYHPASPLAYILTWRVERVRTKRNK